MNAEQPHTSGTISCNHAAAPLNPAPTAQLRQLLQAAETPESAELRLWTVQLLSNSCASRSKHLCNQQVASSCRLMPQPELLLLPAS
jgi:hypothetical protein